MEPTDDIENLRREINELKDRNTALQVQIREYSETIMDHHKVSVCVHAVQNHFIMVCQIVKVQCSKMSTLGHSLINTLGKP